MLADKRIILACFFLFNCLTGFSQTNLPPVAQNDSATVTQPYFDTINVTANDYSPSGDSFCITRVYGSSLFSKLNCNQIAFRSDSSAFGNDTAWYVVCNENQAGLCDTAMLVVTVLRHYTPMMLNNARWTTYVFIDGEAMDPGNSPEQYYWTYYWTATDTLINNISYRVLYQKAESFYNFNGPVYSRGSVEIAGYLRQDTLGRKVYFLPFNSNNEQLLYDFNISIGDTLNRTAYDTAFVVSFDYFKSNGSYYRRTNIGNENQYLGWYYTQNAWIEGIGSTQGIITPYDQAFSQYLICFSTNGQTIYPSYSADTCAYTPVGIETIPTIETVIYPNPANGFCTLKLSDNNERLSASVFDVMGREVLTLFSNQPGTTFNFNVRSLADGVYFVKVKDNNGNVGITKLVKQ